MHAAVVDAEQLADAVGTVEYSDQRFSDAEKRRLASACHRVLNLVEPVLYAGSDPMYHNH
jgi:hypothetical protein